MLVLTRAMFCRKRAEKASQKTSAERVYCPGRRVHNGRTQTIMDPSPQPSPTRRAAIWGLLVRRDRWGLSLRGWLLLLVLAAGCAAVAWCKAHAFLAVTRPVAAEVLIIEGWIPDYALDEAVEEIRAKDYRRVLTCGGITKDGWRKVPKYTAADWAAERLTRRGITNGLFAVPCRVEAGDRTYQSALAVRRWFATNAPAAAAVNVVTLGPHGRRTRLLFEKGLGGGVKVGIIALRDRDYDPGRWWQSSDGVRQVVGEMIAYVYARCFFFPSDAEVKGE
jgi:hypothetical protein